MNLQFQPIQPTFGARVLGADLKRGIGPAEVACTFRAFSQSILHAF